MSMMLVGKLFKVAHTSDVSQQCLGNLKAWAAGETQLD
jgi:hypothetical protein